MPMVVCSATEPTSAAAHQRQPNKGRFCQVRRMDGFALTIAIALAALSSLNPDWKEDEKSGWVQVGAMAFGLVLLGAYMMLR
jgi:hypothetical protein